MRHIRVVLSLYLATGSLPDVKRDDGQTLVEYALILSLLAVVVIVGVTTLGGKAKGLFSSVSSAL